MGNPTHFCKSNEFVAICGVEFPRLFTFDSTESDCKRCLNTLDLKSHKSRKNEFSTARYLYLRRYRGCFKEAKRKSKC